MSRPKKEDVIPVSFKMPLSLADALATDSAWNANKSAVITTALREYVARRAASPAPAATEPAPDDLRQLVMLLVTEVHRLAGGAVSPDLIAAAGLSLAPDQIQPAAPPPTTGRKRTKAKPEPVELLPFSAVIVSTGTKGDGEPMPLIEARNHYVYALYHAGYDAAFIAAQLKAEADATGVKSWAISKATIVSMVKKVTGRQHSQPTPAAMADYQPLAHPDVVSIARRSHVCAITMGAKGSKVSQRLTPPADAE